MLEVGDGYEKTDVRTNDKKLKWLVIISVVLVALGTVGIGIASVYHMKYALKSLFNMEFNTGNDSWSYGKNEQLPECGNVKKICLQGESLDTWKSAAVEYLQKASERI